MPTADVGPLPPLPQQQVPPPQWATPPPAVLPACLGATALLLTGTVAVTVGSQAAVVTGAVGVVVTAIDALLTYRTVRIEVKAIDQMMRRQHELEQQRQRLEAQHRVDDQSQPDQPDIGGPMRPRRVGLGVSGAAPGPQYWHGVEASMRLGR